MTTRSSTSDPPSSPSRMATTILGCIPKSHRFGSSSSSSESSQNNLTPQEKQRLWIAQQDQTQIRYENLTMNRVKIILRDVTFFLEQNKLLQVTGIYRRGPVISKKNEFKQRVNSDQMKIHINLQDWLDQPHTLTACLKDLLRELDEPLLLIDNYDRIVNIGKMPELESLNVEEFAALSLEIVESLPKKNRQVFEILLDHLVQVVLCENANSMSTHALAIIWSPCIIKAASDDMAAGLRNQNFCIKFLTKVLDARLQEVKLMRAESKTPSSLVGSLNRVVRSASSRSNLSGRGQISNGTQSTRSSRRSLVSDVERKSGGCGSDASSLYDKLSISNGVKFAEQVCDRL